jgi:hypothetical protein
MIPVAVENYRVIGISDVMLNAENILDIVIKLIKINIGEKLRCQITDRQPFRPTLP